MPGVHQSAAHSRRDETAPLVRLRTVEQHKEKEK